MKNIIKTSIVATLVCLFGCKKESLPAPADEQSAYRYVNFDRIKKTVETNLLNSSPFFDGEYSIKCLNHYRDQYGVDKVSKYSVWVSEDTGKIYLTGPKKIRYIIIKSTRMMDGFHLHFMQDVYYRDFTVTPAVVSDATTEMVVRNIKTGRSFKILASDFRTQGFWMIHYQ